MSEQQGFSTNIAEPVIPPSQEGVHFNEDDKKFLIETGEKFDEEVTGETSTEQNDSNDNGNIEKNNFNLPESADAFTLFNPSLGRTRLIPSFNHQLSEKLGNLIHQEIQQYGKDHDSQRKTKVKQYIDFAAKARKFYSDFEHTQGQTVTNILERLKYLGLTKDLIVEGENAHLVQAIVKSADFGRLTPEDRGVIRDESVSKNIIQTGEKPELHAIQSSGSLQDTELLNALRSLTTDTGLESFSAEFSQSPEIQKLVEWTARQTITRRLLPRAHEVSTRKIDMNKLIKVKDMAADSDSPEMERFQASNPISLWNDPETGRRFIVKHCPEQTLQADYFGLEMLQLAGVPIYEFYFGETSANGQQKKVLVTGFLEGFSNPADLYDLPEGAPAAMAKAHFPEEYHSNRIAQRGLLVEVLIGEYNSKPHNFMVHGKSVQHLDQGACLTSTASGKFKGLSPEVGIQDIQDILYSYADWDFNVQHPVNEAYEQIVSIDNGQLVVKDIPYAERLLHQLQSIPEEKIDAALEGAGYKDGPESIQRMQEWIERIERSLLPTYQQKLLEQPSDRVKQYIRWAEGAIKSFQEAIAEGGELSYYKKVLRSRKKSLEGLWNNSIEEAKPKKAETNS